MWTVLLSVTAAVVLVVGGRWLCNDLTTVTRNPMSKDEFTVQLYKMSDGTGLLVYDLAQNDAVCGAGWGGGNGVVNLTMYEPCIQLGNERSEKLYGGYRIYKEGYWTDDGWVFYHYLSKSETTAEQDCVQQIWIDYGDGQELIYTHGDEVPTCSPEMEAYLAYLHNPPDIGKGKYGMEYDYDKLAELRAAVPEWQ